MCDFSECDRPAETRGLCDSHYQQRRRGHDLTPIHHRPTPPEVCTVDGCSDPGYCRDMCRRHYNQQTRRARTLREKQNRPVRLRSHHGDLPEIGPVKELPGEVRQSAMRGLRRWGAADLAGMLGLDDLEVAS